MNMANEAELDDILDTGDSSMPPPGFDRNRKGFQQMEISPSSRARNRDSGSSHPDVAYAQIDSSKRRMPPRTTPQNAGEKIVELAEDMKEIVFEYSQKIAAHVDKVVPMAKIREIQEHPIVAKSIDSSLVVFDKVGTFLGVPKDKEVGVDGYREDGLKNPSLFKKFAIAWIKTWSFVFSCIAFCYLFYLFWFLYRYGDERVLTHAAEEISGSYDEDGMTVLLPDREHPSDDLLSNLAAIFREMVNELIEPCVGAITLLRMLFVGGTIGFLMCCSCPAIFMRGDFRKHGFCRLCVYCCYLSNSMCSLAIAIILLVMYEEFLQDLPGFLQNWIYGMGYNMVWPCVWPFECCWGEKKGIKAFAVFMIFFLSANAIVAFYALCDFCKGIRNRRREAWGNKRLWEKGTGSQEMKDVTDGGGFEITKAMDDDTESMDDLERDASEMMNGKVKDSDEEINQSGELQDFTSGAGRAPNNGGELMDFVENDRNKGEKIGRGINNDMLLG